MTESSAHFDVLSGWVAEMDVLKLNVSSHSFWLVSFHRTTIYGMRLKQRSISQFSMYFIFSEQKTQGMLHYHINSLVDLIGCTTGLSNTLKVRSSLAQREGSNHHRKENLGLKWLLL